MSVRVETRPVVCPRCGKSTGTAYYPVVPASGLPDVVELACISDDDKATCTKAVT